MDICNAWGLIIVGILMLIYGIGGGIVFRFPGGKFVGSIGAFLVAIGGFSLVFLK